MNKVTEHETFTVHFYIFYISTANSFIQSYLTHYNKALANWETFDLSLQAHSTKYHQLQGQQVKSAN